MKLEERLMELRMEKGLTQDQVADAMEVSRQTVSRWELGETKPGTTKLIKLSEIFQVPLEYLVKGEVPFSEAQEEERKENPAPAPVKSRRGMVALVFILAAILTMAMVIGYYLGKGGGTEEVIPIEKLQEKKAVPSPESEFEFTWEE